MTDPQAQAVGPAAFPMWRTVGDAFIIMFRNPGPLLAMALIPMVISGSITAFSMTETGGVPYDLAAYSPSIVWMLLTTVVGWLVYSIFAVSWHRFVLFGKRDTVSPVQFYLGRRELTFFLYLALLMIPMSAPGFLMIGMIGSTPPEESAGIVLGVSLLNLVGTIGGIFIWIRCMFIFPAVAVDESPRLRIAWRRGKGIWWRLFGAVTFTSLPGIVIAMAFGWQLGWLDPQNLANMANDRSAMAAYVITSQVIGYVIGSAGVAVVSLAFKRQTGWSPRAAPGDAA